MRMKSSRRGRSLRTCSIAGCAGADAAESADSRSHEVCRRFRDGKGRYVLADAPGGKPDVILMGTGSEVSLCVDAYEKLKAEGVKARVVSMPSWEIFEQQDAAYKESVLPSNVTARVSVEMASTFGWERYTGLKGRNVGHAPFWGVRAAERFA